MKNKKLYLLILGIVVLLGVATGGIIAWLTDTKTIDSQTFTVGEVKYTWTPGTLAASPVVPGQPLITTGNEYKLTNGSNVDSELRVKITIEYEDSEEEIKDAIGPEYVLFTLGTGWGELTEGYYYYAPSSEPVISKDNHTPFDVLTALSLNGATVGNDFAGIKFTMTLTFEAKQADYVTWAELGTATIDFGTGLTQTP